jgi:hypothetical protein
MGEGPDLVGASETIGAADDCEVGGPVHVIEAWDSREAASSGFRDLKREAVPPSSMRVSVACTVEEAVELVGEGRSEVWVKEGRVVDPGAEGVDRGRATAADFSAVEGE